MAGPAEDGGDAAGGPGARSAGEYKYFVSNAPSPTDLELLLRVAFYRADVEHLFRVAQEEVGLSHFEGRLGVTDK